jgi:putative spermidine/putrescine transport system permease protein
VNLGSNRVAVTLVLAVFAFEMLPILVIVSASFGTAAYVEVPPRGLTLAWYYRMFQERKYLAPLQTSLLLAGLAVSIDLLIAAPSAYALTRFTFRFRRLFDAVTLMPIIVPEIVLAISILQLASFFGGFQSFSLAVVGHSVLAFPFILRPIVATLASLDPSIEEAAIGLGASRLTAFRRIVLPHARIGLVAGAILGGIVSFEGFFVSLFLSNAQTLPIVIWEILRFDFSPAVLALSTTIVVLMVPLVMIVEWMVGFRSIVRMRGG